MTAISIGPFRAVGRLTSSRDFFSTSGNSEPYGGVFWLEQERTAAPVGFVVEVAEGVGALASVDRADLVEGSNRRVVVWQRRRRVARPDHQARRQSGVASRVELDDNIGEEHD